MIVCNLHLKIEIRSCAREASVVWHLSLPFINSFNKNEAAFFSKTNPYVFQDHPGTEILAVDAYNNADSVVNLLQQVEDVALTMTAFMSHYPDGVHLICYSQGRL